MLPGAMSCIASCRSTSRGSSGFHSASSASPTLRSGRSSSIGRMAAGRVPRIEADVFAMMASLGIDLDTDDASDANDPLLDSTSPGLDSFAYLGGRPLVGAIEAGRQAVAR